MWRKTFIASAISLLTFISFAGAAETAELSQNTILVDGEAKSVSAYMIQGNNYFKLRDFAALVNGTEKQFQVEWDNASQAIRMTSEMPYTMVGGELSNSNIQSQKAYEATSAIYLNGEQIAFTGYSIAGNNYFKLRDMAKRFNIGVEYDNQTGQVQISTDQSYTKTAAENEASKRAQAYLSVIDKLTAQYGEMRELSGGKAVSGLVTAMLVDFDSDENPELVCGYADDELNERGRNLNSYLSVYHWNGSSAEKITNQRAAYLFSGNGDPTYFSYGSIELYEENGKIYSYTSSIGDWALIQANSEDRRWAEKLQTVQNGKWVDALSVDCTIEWMTNPIGELFTMQDNMTGATYQFSGQTVVSGNREQANALDNRLEYIKSNLKTYAIDPPMQEAVSLHYETTPPVKETVLLLQSQAL